MKDQRHDDGGRYPGLLCCAILPSLYLNWARTGMKADGQTVENSGQRAEEEQAKKYK